MAKDMHKKQIRPETMIPQLLRDYPQARTVLDRWGLKGCGGPQGPYESLEFFARAHEVPEDILLAELENSMHLSNTGVAVSAEPADIADQLYKPYFIAAITVVLTLGAAWGAWILYLICKSGSYAAVTVHEINAHGQAQVFGWMGLFIMGFSYQAFPRFWHTNLRRPRLAIVVLVVMLAGIVTAAMGLMMATSHAYGPLLAVAGSALELAAIVIYSVQIIQTWENSNKQLESYIGYILSALCWFMVSGACNLWHVYNTTAPGTAQQLSWWVSTFQPSLRTMQFYGVGMMMILGVSLRTLPHFFSLPKMPEKQAWIGVALVNCALLLDLIISLVLKPLPGSWASWLVMIPSVLLLVVGFGFVANFKLWKPFPEFDRSAKFIAAGYGWLMLSLVMLVVQPVYIALLNPPSAHAFMAATHHAITVGFISMMIVGYGAKIVATLNGVNPAQLTKLWIPFALLNIGCALRVGGQVATDWTAVSFPLTGISGILELSALVIWSVHVVGMVCGRYNRANTQESCAPPSQPLGANSNVAQVLDAHPETLAVFLAYGFAPLANPLMRKTIATQVTIAMACKMHEINIDDFMQALANVPACPSNHDHPPQQCSL